MSTVPFFQSVDELDSWLTGRDEDSQTTRMEGLLSGNQLVNQIVPGLGPVLISRGGSRLFLPDTQINRATRVVTVPPPGDLPNTVSWGWSQVTDVVSWLVESVDGVARIQQIRERFSLDSDDLLVLLGEQLTIISTGTDRIEPVPPGMTLIEYMASEPAPPVMPSIASMVGNFVKTAVDVVKTAVQTGQVTAGETLFNERMAVCNVCDKFDKDQTRCTKCGCHMNAKANLLAAKCPLGLWRE